MRLEQVLFSQGFGARRECRGLIAAGRVVFDGELIDDPDREVEPEGKVFTVDGGEWPYFEKAVIAMNKPAGYECSTKPKHHPGVLTLLPPPLRVRNVQPVGRLDEDTTGLLILTDDGALQHRLIHPKRHVKKVYQVTLKHAASETLCKELMRGVKLVDENELIAAEEARLSDATTLMLTISSGKYHQVKRMVAAAGNRVEALRRVAFGLFELPGNLPEGKWMWLSGAEVILNPQDSRQ